MYLNKHRVTRILRSVSAFVAILPLVSSFLLSYFQVTPPSFIGELTFNKEGYFVILSLPNLQEGNQGFSSQTKDNIIDIIDRLNPNLVVLSGNNISPQPLIADLFLAYTMDTIDNYVELFDATQTYFTVIFGNTDIMGLYDKSAQTKRFMRSKYFVGGVNSTNNLETLYNRRKSLVGNYRFIVKGDDINACIYVLDFQDKSTLSAQQTSWVSVEEDNCISLILSYKKLYTINEDNEVSYMINADIDAYVSFAETDNETHIIQDNTKLLAVKEQFISLENGDLNATVIRINQQGDVEIL